MRTYKIKEITNRIFSGGTPSTTRPDYWDGDLNWLSSGETRNPFIKSTEKKITTIGVSNSSTRLAHIGDTVIASAGQGYTRGQTSLLKINTYINQSIVALEPNKQIVVPEYLFYNLSNRYDEMRLLSDSSSTRGSITTKMVSDMTINLPNISDQQHIVDTIGSVDDLIEKNKRIISKLEEHITLNFLSIYKDVEENKTLKELCQILLGGTPPRENTMYWNGDIPWINSGEINKDAILEATEYITQLGLNKSAAKLMPKNTVVLAITGATLGQVSILKISCCANQSVVGIVPSTGLPCEYLFPLIKYKISKLVSMQTGGAQQHINKDNIGSLKIFVPNKKEMDLFLNKTKPLFSEQERLLFENKSLISIKQQLLNKYF